MSAPSPALTREALLEALRAVRYWSYETPGELADALLALLSAGDKAEAPPKKAHRKKNPCLLCGEDVKGPLGPHMIQHV